MFRIKNTSKSSTKQFLSSVRTFGPQKRFELLLRHSEEKFRALFKNTPMPTLIWLRHESGFFLEDYNFAVEQAFGVDVQECMNVSAEQRFADWPKLIQAMRIVCQKKNRIAMEGIFEISVDHEKYVIVTLVYIPEKRILMQIEDITERKEYKDQAHKLSRFPNENPNPVINISSSGKILYANPASKDMLAYMNTAVGGQISIFWRDILNEAMVKRKSKNVELKLKDKIYIFTLHPLPSSSEANLYGLDITEMRRAKQEVALNAKIMDSMVEGVTITDKNGVILSVNRAFEVITGYKEHEVKGHRTSMLKSNRHTPDFYEKLWQNLSQTGRWEGEIWNRRKNGEVYPEWLTITGISNDLGDVEKYIAIFSDRSELKSKDEAILYYSYHDPLTGLPNKNLMEDRLNKAIAKAEEDRKNALDKEKSRKDKEENISDDMDKNNIVSQKSKNKKNILNSLKIGLLFIDIDRFKSVNESMGPLAGDYLLQMAAVRMRQVIGTQQTLSRIGGDDFILLDESVVNARDLSDMAKKIMQCFIDPFLVNEQELYASVSIGISIYPDDGHSAQEIYKNADKALADAKQSGSNRFHFYSAQTEQYVNNKVVLESKLRKALDEKNFALYYQPIVCALSGNIVGAEALIRWIHPDDGIISPAEFIPLAEETGLITRINDWTIAQASMDNALMQKQGLKKIYVTVNITAHQFEDQRIVRNVNEALQNSGLAPEYLILEITETSMMQNAESNIKMINKLRQKGIRFSIDDFGTGYSSLSYLKKLPLDNLKLDRSFVIDLPGDSESVAIAKMVLALAKALNLKVIAEGVEDRDQFHLLRDNGSDYIQGYYFSKPVPLDDLMRLLSNDHYDVH